MKKRKGQQQGRNSAGLVTVPTGDIRIGWIFILVKKKQISICNFFCTSEKKEEEEKKESDTDGLQKSVDRIIVFTKIQLVVYYQCCFLTG